VASKLHMTGVMDPQNASETRQTPEATDEDLVEQSKQGDEAAVAHLIRRHYGSSLRIAQSILRNQPDSEDAVQTAYGRAFRQLHTFREEARFSTWITSIVVNQSLMQVRRHRRATVLSLEEPFQERTQRCLISREPTPEESAVRREISSAIARALAKLPHGLRMPYTLHAISGLPIAEVADRLGLSISATKSRIFRARCTLQSRLYFSYGPALRSA
jgi:RNA polymerase sigma-70 factor (ECF subfamily)